MASARLESQQKLQFLAAIADASHSEHKEWMAWLCSDFDPNRFDAMACDLHAAQSEFGYRSV